MNINKYPVIALIGNGAMGKEITKITTEKSIHIARVFDEANPLSKDSPVDFDVLIDFSSQDAVLHNVQTACILNKNIVIGTTGWSLQMKNVKELVENSSIGVVYGSNYSIGMQVFFRIVRQAATLINSTPNYDIFIQEIHHKHKADSPSGSALTLAEIILNEVSRKKSINTETSHGKISEEDLHVTSVRGGNVAGTHTLILDSASDSIELTHRAKNRSGFASGALLAAGWIWNKKGLYDFTQHFDEIILTSYNI